MSINFSAMNQLYGVSKGSFKTNKPVYRPFTYTPTQAPEKTDAISISPEGSFLQEVSKVSKNVMGEIRQLDTDHSARINELRSQIENGTYRVPTSALADAILQQDALL